MATSEQLQALMKHAGARKMAPTSYAGDVTAAEAWEYLSHAPAYVMDVRTSAEWSFSGVPSLQGTQGNLACISWLRYPDFEANPAFRQEMEKHVTDAYIPVFFLCKTGGRSHQAANHAAAHGYPYSFNILHGFEGDHNAKGQRGQVNGWKAEGLPWTQA